MRKQRGTVPPPDWLLLSLASEGQETAVAELRRRHHAEVMKACKTVVKARRWNVHASTLSDCVEKAFDEVCAKGHEHAERRRDSARSLLKTAAKREIIDALRKRTSEEKHNRVRATRGGDPIEPDSSENLVHHEEEQALLQAIGELDPIYRDTLMLRWVDGLSAREIAKRLTRAGRKGKKRLSDATIRTRLSRGAAKLGRLTPLLVSSRESTAVATFDGRLVADGSGRAKITVALRDARGRALASLRLAIRGADRSAVWDITDENGVARGSVSSRTPGARTLSVTVPTSGAPRVLFDQPRLTFART